MSANFGLALDELRRLASGAVDKGSRFERLMGRAFATHPYEYGPQRFKRVWLWSDWPGRVEYGSGKDIGIDLVGEQTEAHGGGLCAIQCKNYAPDHKVPTSGVNSFLAASEADEFTSRIMVVTSGLTKDGQTKVDKASPRCEVLDYAKLDAWPVNWHDFLDKPEDLVFNFEDKHQPRADQREALDAVGKGYLQGGGCGRLVMPCGTGKSVVAMWAAEENVGPSGTVLYLVPSIALMGQTMREWSKHRRLEHVYLGVCSDKTTGRSARNRSRDGNPSRDLAELSYPVSTNREQIAEALRRTGSKNALDRKAGRWMRVIFSTYQSLPTLADVLAEVDPADVWGCKNGFDMVICDEAHRTTGVEMSRSDQSAFRLVHDQRKIPAHFRLFMTATQRIYTDAVKDRAFRKYGSDVYSMDDEDVYGPLLYEMTFSDAVDRGLLSDYEVLIVATSETRLTTGMSKRVSAINTASGRKNVVEKEDAVKLLGIWDAFADPRTMGTQEGRATGQLSSDADNPHLRTAIAFTNKVDTSKAIAGSTRNGGGGQDDGGGNSSGLWQAVVDEATASQSGNDLLKLSVGHVDGSTPAVKRAVELGELLKDPKDKLCRIITNARVLTEGVDVPALDAVVFLQRRTSRIDIIQAVGRVMRRHPNKKKGYVVLPVVVPEGKRVNDVEVIEASDFAVVWDVIRALRSHDERVDIWVNSFDAAKSGSPVRVLDSSSDRPPSDDESVVEQLRFMLDHKIASKMVDMCGDRQMWPTWGVKAAKVCREVREKVDAQLVHSTVRDAFGDFLAAMCKAVGDHLTENEAVEMVAQHVVTIPIFDCLFKDSEFAASNPISVVMNNFLSSLQYDQPIVDGGVSGGADLARLVFEEELRPLSRAYTTMQTVLEGAVTPAAKVDVLREIYEGFFEAAMKDVVGRLGVVYTPVWLVDFIVWSADAVCRKHFGHGLTAENVNILDPFTGTGTFIYRILTCKDDNGGYIIGDSDLQRKYFSELHANELVLLAYYIAAIKIEAGMAERGGFTSSSFAQFPGVTFGDTFLISEMDAGVLPGMSTNMSRKNRQAYLPIRVIVMNPPWSAGQKSAGDDNPNIDYPELGERVRGTYGKRHKDITGRAAGGNSAGNLYVQAIRWASDRLDTSDAGKPHTGKLQPGVVALVHPNSLTDGTSLAGMRAALRAEFDHIYVVNLRGDAYKSGEERRREGDNIFGQGSRNGGQITVLVRDTKTVVGDGWADLSYAEVPEYQSLAQKKQWLAELGDVTNSSLKEVPITARHDWVHLPDGTFEKMMPVYTTVRKTSKKNRTSKVSGVAVSRHAAGVKTNCDSYVYDFTYNSLKSKVLSLIDAYETVRERFNAGEVSFVQATANNNLGCIKWTDTLKRSLRSNKRIVFDESRIREVLYRPFMKQWLYVDDRILSSVNTVANMFPQQDRALSQKTPTGGGGRCFSPNPPTELCSESSPRTVSAISAERARTSRHDSSLNAQSREGENNPIRGTRSQKSSSASERHVEHDVSSFSGRHSTGFGVHQRVTPDQGATSPEDVASSGSHPTGGGGHIAAEDRGQRNHGSSVQPHAADSVRGARHRQNIRPVRHWKANQVRTPTHSRAELEAIVTSDASKQIPFGVIAVGALFGLHLTGRESRGAVRKRFRKPVNRVKHRS